jgi:hypothetical protein
MDIKTELELLVETHGLKHYTIILKKNKKLLQKIFDNTKSMPDDSTISERIWSIVNDKIEAVCENGNRKKFNSYTKGYRFCSFNCECSLVNQSNKMKNIQNTIDKNQRKTITEKRLKTTHENKPLNQLKSFLVKNNFEFDSNVKISGMNISMMFHQQKFAIEFVELKQIQHDKNHQLNKLIAVNKMHYRLITIYEDEWIDKKEIVKRRILHFLGKSEFGCGARKTQIKEIEWKHAKKFLDTYHIQESGQSGETRLGAYYNDKLIGVMVFAKPNITRGGKTDSGQIELSRFATDGKNYPGLASKFLQHYVRLNDVEIITYADRRWSDGNVYLKMGMEQVYYIKSNYHYYNGIIKKRQHRWKFQKKEVMHLVEDGENKTEKQIMEELNWIRLYDCGNIKFIYNKK